MKQAEEYRRNAVECRRLAGFAVTSQEREQLLDVAKTWEALAVGRENFVNSHPELHAQRLAEETAKQAR
jgi:hypothetical protein